MLLRQHGERLAFQYGQAVQVIIKRVERSGPGIAQNLVEPPAFGLAGEKRDAKRLGLAHFLGHLRQHGNAARDMKTADANGQSGRQEWPRDIDGAGKLVRLHANQADQRLAAAAQDRPDNFVRTHPAVGFVVCVNFYVDVRPQHLAVLCVQRQTVQTGERVGGDCRAEPLYRVAIVVVMGRLDEHDMEIASAQYGHGSTGSFND